MGSWNGTCAITQLHITSGEPVAVFMLTESKYSDNFCYSSAYYNPCYLPFFGKYNDYGSVEECTGIGLGIILDEIRSRLTEFPQGPNEYHDPAASRALFDEEALFDLDHEGRLYIDGRSQNAAESFETKDLGTRVTHVIIHGTVFNHLLDTWKQTEYVRDTSDAGYHYTEYGFKDIVESIPAYIAEFRKQVKESSWGGARMDNYRDTILAASWLSSGRSRGSLFDNSSVEQYSITHTDAELAEVLTDFLKGVYVDAFMLATRKAWIKQVGEGSQNNDAEPYEVLIESMKLVIDREKHKYDCDD